MVQSSSRTLHQFVPVIATLTPHALPAWGTMTPQHMVEHLHDAMLMSMGKLSQTVSVVTEPERLPSARRFLLGSSPLPHNVASPLMSSTLFALSCSSLEEAQTRLYRSIDEFYSFFEAYPTASFPHPFFGVLNAAEWEHFHGKHFRHHCAQFGLLVLATTEESSG